MSTPVTLVFTFFDSNILIGQGWPKRSGKFEQLLSLSKTVGFKLCIPQVVRLEVRNNFERETTKIINSLRSKGQKLHYFQNSINVPTLEYFLTEYDRDIEEFFEENNFIMIPLPEDELERFVNMAVDQKPPFRDKDKGFRDTVILISILQYLQNFQNHDVRAGGFLISDDSIFSKPEVKEIIASYGVKLVVFDSLDAFEAKVTDSMDTVRRANKEREEEELKQYLDSITIQIEEYIKENIEFSKSDFYSEITSTIDEVTNLQVQEITRAHVSPEDDDGNVAISFELICNVLVTASHWALPEAKFRIGEKPVTLETPEELGRLNVVSHTISKSFVAEATAKKKDGKFSNLSITSIRLNPPVSIFNR